uniref:protein-serine/threonine phosphatase n=1 Tax=Kalanchoe fedtschenkoi TaxID=63787 RepID=A0A7N0TT37_KALFE
MAGCCEVVAEGETSAAATAQVEPSLRSRRRKMELQQFKFTSVPLQENKLQQQQSRKRQRMEQRLPRDCKGAVQSCYNDVEEEEFEVEEEEVIKDSKRGKCGIDLNLKAPEKVAGEGAKFGFTSVCGRRRDMEDAVSIRPRFLGPNQDCHFFGVFDGHGCSHVAARCKARMHEIVKSEVEKANMDEESWKEALGRSFSLMDAEAQTYTEPAPPNTCRCELQMPQCDAVGSTAVVAVVSPDKIVVSNCGDSRAVLCRNGVAIPLSSDHKPDRPDELERIERAGGRVIYWDGPRVLGVLAMSRAIGDNYLKPYVIPEPEVKIVDREEQDECLILASDGLWDVVSNETACGVARMCLRAQHQQTTPGCEKVSGGWGEGSSKACLDASILLTKLALARHSSDNVSVVVIDLKKIKDDEQVLL